MMRKNGQLKSKKNRRRFCIIKTNKNDSENGKNFYNTKFEKLERYAKNL